MRRHVFFLVSARKLGNDSIRICAEENSFAEERALQRGSKRQKKTTWERESFGP